MGNNCICKLQKRDSLENENELKTSLYEKNLEAVQNPQISQVKAGNNIPDSISINPSVNNPDCAESAFTIESSIYNDDFVRKEDYLNKECESNYSNGSSYTHARNIFNFINEFRMNPNHLISILEAVLNKIEEKGKKLIVNLSSFEYINNFKLNNNLNSKQLSHNSTKDAEIKENISNLNNNCNVYTFTNLVSLNQLKENFHSLKREISDTFNEPLLWSEKVVQYANNRIMAGIDFDNTFKDTPAFNTNGISNGTNSSFHPERKTILSPDNFEIKLEFEFLGRMDPKLTVVLILLEMTVQNSIYLLTSDFEYSGVLCREVLNKNLSSERLETDVNKKDCNNYSFSNLILVGNKMKSFKY